MKRKIISIIFIALILSLTCSCSQNTDEKTLDNFLSTIEGMVFPRVYSYLDSDSMKEISLNDMTDRFENIYNTLSLTKISFDDIKITQKSSTTRLVDYRVTMTSSVLGEFTLPMELEMKLEDGTWKIVWSPAIIIPTLEENESIRLDVIHPKRGEIFDVNGNLLAKNDAAQSVYVDTSQIADSEVLVRRLSDILLETEDNIRKKLDKYINVPEGEERPKDMAVLIKSYPLKDLTQSQLDQLAELPGVGVDDSYFVTTRVYPYGTLLSHTLGYTGTISEEELAMPENEGLNPDSQVGKAGLEKAYDTYLRGKDGYRLSVVSEDGQEKEEVLTIPCQDGNDLWLSIDVNLQQQAELQLMQYLTDEMAGSVVIMDPETGYVEAIANAPDYNPNDFTLYMSPEKWEEYNSTQGQLPLINRAVSGLYPPGSTFKPFTAAMALESGVLDENSVFNEPIEDNIWTPTIEGWTYPGIKRFMQTPEPLNLRNAILYSDNIYFANAALKVGTDSFWSHCEKYGFGSPFPFDLTVATSAISNSDGFETIKLLADSGYGQGELLISPLQMASLFSVFANSNGVVMQPHVVTSIKATQEDNQYGAVETFEPNVLFQDIIQSSTLSTIRPLLRGVVSDGTATQLNIAGLDVCAKTGTAQKGSDNDREIAWIIAYNDQPYWDGSKRLICVTLEVPADEGGIRTDIAKALLKYGMDQPEEEDQQPSN